MSKFQKDQETVSTDLPSSRFQEEKTVLNPDDLGVTKDTIPGNVTGAQAPKSAARALRAKMKVAPDVSVDVSEDKQVGGVPLVAQVGLRSVAGVTGQSGTDDASKIPYSGGRYRPETRYGKKRSDDLFELDNTPIEQVTPVVEDCPDLKANPDGGVGYDGRQQFKQTRSKKNYTYINGSGTQLPKLPQQLLNDASADAVYMSKTIYTCGQVVGQPSRDADYPTRHYDGSGIDVDNEFQMHKGNYKPTALNITIANGQISDINIDEHLIGTATDPIARDASNVNWQIDRNNVAKTVIKLQTMLGRETTSDWSPLGYVIDQPYEYNMLMHDIEASTGAIMALTERAAVSGLAFQRNITRKDGINPQRNAIKMVVEGYAGDLANDTTDCYGNLSFGQAIFNKAEYRNGSPAAMIAMFDSLAKYRTKADLLGMQRSWSMHLSQVANNIKPFRMKPSTMKTIDKMHMFSTVDGNYNPFLPFYATKRMTIINPLSLNAFLVGWKHPDTLTSEEKQDVRRSVTTGTYAMYMYQYSDLRNSYATRVSHPVIEGLVQWLLEHEGAFVSTYADSNGNATISIPFNFYFTTEGMLQLMLASASQDIALQRNIIFRDVLFAGDQETYIWDDLKSLSEVEPLRATQLTIGNYNEPLKMGKLATDSVLRIMFPDHMQLSDYTSSGGQYFLPFYFNERAYGQVAGGQYTQNEGWFNEQTAFNFSFPSIRDGVRHEYVDIIKAMSIEDVMLSLDRKMDIPTFTTTVVQKGSLGGATDVTLWTAHDPVNTSTGRQYAKLSTIRYDANSDGRLVVKYDVTTGSNRQLNAFSLLQCPKELGLFDDDYTDRAIITHFEVGADGGLNFTQVNVDHQFTVGAAGTATLYDGAYPFEVQAYRVQDDSYTNGAIDRSAALTNIFYSMFATMDANDINTDFVTHTGLVVSRAYNDGHLDNIPGVYNLGSNVVSVNAIDTNIRSDAAYIWTMMQRLFFPINPFANSFSIDQDNHSYDPAEASFYYGVCGFLAADYTQVVLERLDAIDQLGIDYTEDIYYKQSLILR